MNYFPTYLALGNAFCNRKQELKTLASNINMKAPTLIMSPRRYGKTSLALNVLNKLKLPYSHIDFYKELSEEGVEQAILNGIGNLIAKIEKGPKKLLKLASDFFADMQVRVVVEKAGITLDFSRYKMRPADNIQRALEKLQQLAKQRKRDVVLFMDEFQVVAEVAQNHSIEAAIRHMAQNPDNISYVFSGSNRYLLQDMFYDKNRPFYRLCDTIKLDRISSKDYEKHINKAAKKTWGSELTEELLATIFELTEMHPYYINKLCSLIWRNDYPTITSIRDYWHIYALENKSFIERELELLSFNQRKLLIHLARSKLTKKPYGTDYVKEFKMPLGSLSQAMKVLIQKDYIFKDAHGYYRILDPLIKYILSN